MVHPSGKRHPRKRYLGLLLAGGILMALWPAAGRSQGVTFNQTHLMLYTGSGRHEFIVDVAESATQVNLGLRYRHSIDPDGGLLIVQSIAAPVVMQLSNEGMSLPMDLLFLASDGTVREVHPWVPPDSSDPLVSTAPVAAALELKGGTITRYGILPGDRVIGGGLGAASP
jgi:uncharacterized membrane protein (UPF0127 family)